jgi:hypothetical protein
MENFKLSTFLTGSLGIIVLIAYLLINAILTSWLAEQKGYSQGSWFFLALFFGPIALLALGFAPDLNTEEILSSINKCYNSLRDIRTSNNDILASTKEILDSTKEPLKSKHNDENIHLNDVSKDEDVLLNNVSNDAHESRVLSDKEKFLTYYTQDLKFSKD